MLKKCTEMLALITYCMLGCAGCSQQDQATNETTILRVAVLPDQTTERIKERYTPLLNYLAAELNIQTKLIIPASYSDLLDKFHRKEIDLARFGGFSFVKAAQKDGAIPIVMRDIDVHFYSYFLVRANDTATNITDYRGKKLMFGSKLSTSGHLMPRYFLQSKNIFVNDFFAAKYFSGAHDKTAYNIRDGVADIGVANALVVDQLYRDGLLKRDEVRILWKTPPYADYVWAAAKQLPDATRLRIQDAFLALSKSNAQQADMMQRLGAGSYLPASISDFSSLKEISSRLGMLDGN